MKSLEKCFRFGIVCGFVELGKKPVAILVIYSNEDSQLIALLLQIPKRLDYGFPTGELFAFAKFKVDFKLIHSPPAQNIFHGALKV